MQHAHNPVNWYPWGDEAFEEARRLKRPILVSIGYSTCHWCHVMEEESFEDEEIAQFLNTHFIAIKVDREERPDVDAVYMAAVQTLTGRGGWPLNVWLSNDQKPFWGGTYFPARDGDRGVSMGFLSILKRIDHLYKTNRGQVEESSIKLTQAVKSILTPVGGGSTRGRDVLDAALDNYRKAFDDNNGGLNGAPKFPSNLPIRLLFRAYYRTGSQEFLNMAELTLSKMAAGGMYDQVGGGIHRYSVDVGWMVPHFEKMLYDNALLVPAYLEGFQISGNQYFEKIARDILRFVERDMLSPGGAFYSAIDADSLTPEGHREEGYFFTWTLDELERELGKDRTRLVKKYFGVTAAGNFEGRNILHRPYSMKITAGQLGLEEETLAEEIEAAKEQLYQARKSKPRPIRDEKILTAWNGLMISAFAKSGLILDDQSYTERAAVAGRFILDRLFKEKKLYCSFKDGKSKHNGYLSDYAFLAAAFLDLFEATNDLLWMEKAIELDAILAQQFEDKINGGFYRTGTEHEELIAKEKPNYDGAVPSGNSIALMNLLRLAEFTGKAEYKKRYEKAYRLFLGGSKNKPTALSVMLSAVDFYLDKPKEIIIVTPEDDTKSAEPFLAEFRKQYIPNSILVVVSQGEDLGQKELLIPMIQHKKAQNGLATAYVCTEGFCRLPTTDPSVFRKQISERLTQ